jgi:hypothetical protein
MIAVTNKLRALRRPDESYSDVIIRVARGLGESARKARPNRLDRPLGDWQGAL